MATDVPRIALRSYLHGRLQYIYLLSFFLVIDIEAMVPPLPDNRPAFTAGERVLMICNTTCSIHAQVQHFEGALYLFDHYLLGLACPASCA